MKKTDNCSCGARRTFLKGCGLTLSGFGLSSLFPGALMQHAMAQVVPSDRRLLFLFMRGGNDGINAVIPHGDPDYSPANRPSIYIPPGSAIDTGNGFASFHPALADTMDAFNAGDMAVVHRVGIPNNSRSHFDDQRIWENGKPAQPEIFEGWLARYITANLAEYGGPIPVLTAQPAPPVMVRGDKAFFNVSDAAGFYDITPAVKQAKFKDFWRSYYAGLNDVRPFRPLLSETGVALIDTLDEYDSWSQATWDPKDPDNPTWSLFPVNPGTNPIDPGGPGGLKFSDGSYPFFLNLKIAVLSLLESGSSANGTRVAGTELNGFDLHSGQGALTGRHAELLSWLAYGLRSARIALSGAAIDPRAYPSIWAKTLVMTMSEFGRTTLGNGSGGTDHGAATCMWLQGGTVNGGVYNCDAVSWPAGAMFANAGRYLLLNTDFRSVFWEVMRDHMQAAGSPDTPFPGYTAGGLAAQELGLITP